VEGDIENHMVRRKKFVHTNSPIFNKIGVSQLELNPQHPV
jgi:hypothetical protein